MWWLPVGGRCWNDLCRGVVWRWHGACLLCVGWSVYGWEHLCVCVWVCRFSSIPHSVLILMLCTSASPPPNPHSRAQTDELHGWIPTARISPSLPSSPIPTHSPCTCIISHIRGWTVGMLQLHSKKGQIHTATRFPLAVTLLSWEGKKSSLDTLHQNKMRLRKRAVSRECPIY